MCFFKVYIYFFFEVSMFRPLLSLLFLMLVVAAVTADSSEPRVARLTRRDNI